MKLSGCVVHDGDERNSFYHAECFTKVMLHLMIFTLGTHDSVFFFYKYFVGCRSLIVMDELGRATSSSDGFAIAWSCCEHLLSLKT